MSKPTDEQGSAVEDLAAVWEPEIIRRIAAVDSGQVEGFSLEEVMTEVEEILTNGKAVQE